MTYIISLFLCLLSFFKRNSKCLFIFFLLFMFAMFGWSNNTADWNIYLNRYYNYSATLSDSEPLFVLLCKLFSDGGFNFRFFLISLSAIIIFGYGILIKRNSSQSNFVLLLYFIYPFIMEVSQIRFAIASLFVTAGLLMNSKNNCTKKDTIVSLILIAISCLFHYASIFCFVYIFAKFLKKEKLIFLTILFIFLCFIFNFITSQNIQFSGSSSLIEKINFVLSLNAKRNVSMVYKSIFRVIIYFLMNLFIYLFFNRQIKTDESKKKYTDTVFKYNIISLILIPLSFYSSDIYRVQQVLSITNYISYSNFFSNNNLIKHKTINKKELLFSLMCILFAFINLYILVLSNTNIYSVFYPFFDNNLIFGK